MSENYFISEQGLDALLNEVFLETHSAREDAQAAGFVFAGEYNVPVDAVKERELIARLKGKPGRSRWWIYLLTFLGTAAIITFSISSLRKNKNAEISGYHLPPAGKNIPAGTKGSGTATIPQNHATASQPFIPQKNKNVLQPPVLPDGQAVPSFIDNLQVNVPAEIPLFTGAQVAVYAKVKNRVLEKLLLIDESLYTRVEEGKLQYKGRAVGVDAFVIRNYPITNLEYKIFLADLVKNGKTDELNAAMAHPQGWNNYHCNKLAQDYFNDEQYDNFPVVNVSVEGAALFCNWLEQQLNDAYVKKHAKPGKLKVRLPCDYEWLYAAKTGYAQVPGCEGYNTIYDPKEGLVDKAFLRRIAQIKRRDRSTATYMDELFSTNRYGMSEEEILKIFERGLLYASEQSADTLYPGGMEALCKAGHVSEIIKNKEDKTVIMGSCWKSKQEYMEMLDTFNKNPGSPFVGFRVVISNPSMAGYKNPFW